MTSKKVNILGPVHYQGNNTMFHLLAKYSADDILEGMTEKLACMLLQNG